MIAIMRKLKGNEMKLIKRRPYSNIYEADGAFRSVIGGVPNVPDANGNLDPLDNEPRIVTDDPRIGILIPRVGLGQVGFHDKATNKYGSIIRLYTGESLIRWIKNFPSGQPTINKAKRFIQWNAGQQWVREYVTEKHCKQVIKQAAGQAFTEVYKLNGLTPKKNGTKIDFLRNGKKAFSIQRPYYIDPTTTPNDWLGYVPLTWQKVGDDYELSYPAPDASVLRGGFAYVDPTIVFGEGGGAQEGGDNKDTVIESSNTDRSYGQNAVLAVRDGVFVTLMRFSLTGHIPTNATVNTSVLSMLTNVDGGGNMSVHDMNTDWGATPTDAGNNGDPPAGNEATWARAFWASATTWSAGNFSAADRAAAEDTQAIAGAGVWNSLSIPTMTGLWIANDSTNYGLALECSLNALSTFHSFEAAAAANRPYLTVDYTVPFVGKSAIGIGIGIGIGI